MALLLMLLVLGLFVSLPHTYVDGEIYGGDIIQNDNSPLIFNEYAAIANTNYRWPGGKIPYLIDGSLGFLLENISLAMQNIMERTCIEFVEKTYEPYFLYIANFKNFPCYSEVGMVGVGSNLQFLNVGPADCHGIGPIVHLFGHVLGFYHEQFRKDRDDYITYHPAFIAEGREKDLTYKFPLLGANFLTPFDVHSIMMPSMNTFSTHPTLYTMTSKKGILWESTETKKGLSEEDIQRINELYICGPA